MSLLPALQCVLGSHSKLSACSLPHQLTSHLVTNNMISSLWASL